MLFVYAWVRSFRTSVSRSSDGCNVLRYIQISNYSRVLSSIQSSHNPAFVGRYEFQISCEKLKVWNLFCAKLLGGHSYWLSPQSPGVGIQKLSSCVLLCVLCVHSLSVCPAVCAQHITKYLMVTAAMMLENRKYEWSYSNYYIDVDSKNEFKENLVVIFSGNFLRWLKTVLQADFSLNFASFWRWIVRSVNEGKE